MMLRQILMFHIQCCIANSILGPSGATTAFSFTNNCDARSRISKAQAIARVSQKSWKFQPIFP